MRSSDLVYFTYFGGSGSGGAPDEVFGLALGTAPTVLVTGVTTSANFPATAGAFQTTLGVGSSEEAFAASLTLQPVLGVSPQSLTFTSALLVPSAAQMVTLTNNTSAALTYTTPIASNVDFAVTATTCGATIASGANCTISVVYTPSGSAPETGTLPIADGATAAPQIISLSGTTLAAVSVAPTSLTFTSPAVGTATASQSVTVTNNSSSAVAFTSAVVTSGGGFAADFAPTTTCTSIPASPGTCTISVVYTPSVATAETGTLTISDGVGLTQTVALSGSVTAVSDFTISAAPSSVTVKRGAAGTSTITVTSLGTFNAAVALTCTGQPRRSTCAIAPGSVTPTAGGSTTATLTLTTKHGLVAPPPSSPRFLPPASIRVVVPAFVALLMVLFFASERRFRTRLGLVAATLVFVGVVAGCSVFGGGDGTPKGTSTLTITGTAGSVTHTTSVSLTVD